MFTKVRSVYSAIGVMLFLIALYLVLVHGEATANIIRSTTNATVGITKALQGRD